MPKHSFFFTRRIDGSKYYISSNKKKKNPDFFFVDHQSKFYACSSLFRSVGEVVRI